MPSSVLFASGTSLVFGSSHISANPVSSERFENPSIFRLMLWYHNSSLTKSLNDLNVLVQNVIRAPDFQVHHFDNFDAAKADEKLFEPVDGSETSLNHGWYETTVPISLACDKVTHKSERNAPILHVTGLYHRKPLEVIRAALQELNAQQFHTAPFEEYWVPHSNGSPERIYSELYNSDAYIQEHGIIHTQTHEDPLEAVVVTPLRGLQDEYIRIFGKAATKEMLTHLRHELVQSIWAVILDDEFMDAYAHGIPFDFQDGIKRRVYCYVQVGLTPVERNIYPRIFTYSADYPKKFLGKHPCPRCVVEKDQIAELGTKVDIKRRKRLARVPINSVTILNILGKGSLTPTQNTFSWLVGSHGADFHSFFVVDLLHEFELGVWQATFTHIIRILYAQGGDAIQELNRRYWDMPIFGRAVIRKFGNNASAMKKLAARDFEDLLQCNVITTLARLELEWR
ncbi:hypothetical protein H4582DRAFT_2069195 [Lactarius indigo]|nr:hypothetical protein H4582DRAFT_2069195 [Lactarius indigo]